MSMKTAAVATVVLGLLFTPASAATYSYTGDNFTSIAFGSYTTSMSVTGSFEVASPLAGNLSGPIAPQSYSFFDGLQTLTNLNSVINGFIISTNSLGDIVSALIQVNANGNLIFVSNGGDSAQIATIPQSLASNRTPGAWQRTDVSAVPIPAALPLLASGLGAIGFIGWRRKRKANVTV